MGSMNTKHKQFSLGIVSPFRLPHPSPLRQLTSVTLPRRQQQSHDPTLRVSMERRSLHDSSITVARSEEQPSESKSAKLRQSLRKSTLYAVPILIWRAGFN